MKGRVRLINGGQIVVYKGENRGKVKHIMRHGAGLLRWDPTLRSKV